MFNYKLNYAVKGHTSSDLIVLGAFQKPAAGKAKTASLDAHWDKEVKAAFEFVKNSKGFTGGAGESFGFIGENGESYLAVGLGEKAKFDFEALRKKAAGLAGELNKKYKAVTIDLSTFVVKSKVEESLEAFVEGYGMATYAFDRHLTKKKEIKITTLTLDLKEAKSKAKNADKVLANTIKVVESVNFARDLVNEPPNILNSETYAKEVAKDAKNLKGVKVKILGKKELQKEKMGMFLAVNAGSAFEPQLVHLTYTPAKANSKTKHIALVGKGLTFDTGGYSLKPGGSMMNMKFDMAGSATVYAAFRAAVMLGAPVKISCFLGMTDNAVNSLATMPDSIVRARNGKTVEILNTDAEGRLVLGDVLDYAGDQKPDVIIDAATLTGACLVALGHEVCGLMGNDQKLADALLKSAGHKNERMWQLPIFDEYREDMKSPIADLKNIGGKSFGGTAKAAAFLENFIQEGISWAHLDIAGIGDGQGHLPYCPKHGASGLVVRSLVDYMINAK